jgi:hypothetical protein
MILAKDDGNEELACEVTLRRLGFMIAASLISSEEKQEMEMRTYLLNESEALELIEYLKEFQPIPGFHTIAHGVKDINTAARFAADKDDFYDRSISAT